MPNTDSQSRLESLRKLLQDSELSTQEELRDKLEKLDFEVTQSTVSRDLRKLGAVKTVDNEGQTIYRLPPEYETPVIAARLMDMIRNISTNGSLIIVQTSVGSASVVARHLDRVRPDGILGTLAGDDTIFVAPASVSKRAVARTVKAIEAAFEEPLR